MPDIENIEDIDFTIPEVDLPDFDLEMPDIDLKIPEEELEISGIDLWRDAMPKNSTMDKTSQQTPS